MSVATVGNVALDIQSILTDPTSAPMILFDLVGGDGGRALTTSEDFATAANAARKIKDADLDPW